MAGSTFQPPIHLDPNQDNSQQTSFINQNFQNLATTLETNSFRIVFRGSTSISSSGAGTTWVTIPHNLGFSPIPFCYLTGITESVGGTVVATNANIPLPTWSQSSFDTIKATATNSGNALPIFAFQTYFNPVADATNLYIFLLNSTSNAIGPFTITYYLVQQPSLQS